MSAEPPDRTMSYRSYGPNLLGILLLRYRLPKKTLCERHNWMSDLSEWHSQKDDSRDYRTVAIPNRRNPTISWGPSQSNFVIDGIYSQPGRIDSVCKGQIEPTPRIRQIWKQHRYMTMGQLESMPGRAKLPGKLAPARIFIQCATSVGELPGVRESENPADDWSLKDSPIFWLERFERKSRSLDTQVEAHFEFVSSRNRTNLPQL
ncbi:hypothetical protein PGT21_007996 [Puccinia graminis f. sp. tritici]|uniref:Uncharacterized protein n=1 Tax=Puccinia graminis f. sp. tritici TaxID=56615 RepID=A0A5B0MF37_PUCGR|nr:hypothetical protein PGT21_007996 [Puccinia graminis f. sp. tritici]